MESSKGLFRGSIANSPGGLLEPRFFSADFWTHDILRESEKSGIITSKLAKFCGIKQCKLHGDLRDFRWIVRCLGC